MPTVPTYKNLESLISQISISPKGSLEVYLERLRWTFNHIVCIYEFKRERKYDKFCDGLIDDYEFNMPIKIYLSKIVKQYILTDGLSHVILDQLHNWGLIDRTSRRYIDSDGKWRNENYVKLTDSHEYSGYMKLKTKAVINSSIKYFKIVNNPLHKAKLLSTAKDLCKYSFDIDEELHLSLMTEKYKMYFSKTASVNKVGSIIDKRHKIKTPLSLDEYIIEQSHHLKRCLHWNATDCKDRLDNFNWSVCDFAGRFFNIFTQNPAIYREHLLRNGKRFECKDIDISCSQPTLLANIMGMCGIPECALTDEIQYGNFHQTNADHFEVTRDEVKSCSMRLMYAKLNSPYHRSFVNMYPKAGEFLTKLKTSKDYFKEIYPYIKKFVSEDVYNEILNYEQRERYVTPCRILQCFEVYVMKKIRIELQMEKVKFLQIHDGVYVEIDKYNDSVRIFNGVLRGNLSYFQPAKTQQDLKTTTGEIL